MPTLKNVLKERCRSYSCFGQCNVPDFQAKYGEVELHREDQKAPSILYCTLLNWVIMFLTFLKRAAFFYIKSPKTKTNVITLSNYKGHRKSIKPIKTLSKYLQPMRSTGKSAWRVALVLVSLLIGLESGTTFYLSQTQPLAMQMNQNKC